MGSSGDEEFMRFRCSGDEQFRRSLDRELRRWGVQEIGSLGDEVFM